MAMAERISSFSNMVAGARKPAEKKIMIKLDVFGRHMGVERSESGGWQVYHFGEGRRRRANDVTIPKHLAEAEIERYLADLFHELASPEHPNVIRLT